MSSISSLHLYCLEDAQDTDIDEVTFFIQKTVCIGFYKVWSNTVALYFR